MPNMKNIGQTATLILLFLSTCTSRSSITTLSVIAPSIKTAAIASLRSRSKINFMCNLRLAGGHKAGCSCGGGAKNEIERWCYDQIDERKIVSINTAFGHEASQAFRPFCEMKDSTKWMQSDGDDQILVCLEFKEFVNIKSIGIVTPARGGAGRIKLFSGREVLDFEEALDMRPDAIWQVPELAAAAAGKGEEDGVVTLPLATVLPRVRVMTLFFETSSDGGDVTRVDWIGIRGQGTNMRVGVVMDSTYELRPLDFKQHGSWSAGHSTTGV